jgi:hypothetical protein
MRFDRLHVSPVLVGYEFRIYNDDDKTYRAVSLSEAAAWRLVEYVMDVQESRKLERNVKEPT